MSIIPEFSTYWINDIAKTGAQAGPDLYRIVELFRDHRRHLAVEEGHISRTTFTTTVDQDQDQDQDQEKDHEKRDCLCGEPHRFKDCPYLIREKRSPDWTPDQEIQDRIKEKLQNPRLKAAVKYARVSQSKSQRSQDTDTDTDTDTESIAEATF